MWVTPKNSGHKDSCQLSAISFQLLDERHNSKNTKTAISRQLSVKITTNDQLLVLAEC